MKKNMSIKTIFYSVQGEGYHVGTPSIFIRFSSCNLWNGKGKMNDRNNAICKICDTDFIGTNGSNGGVYSDQQLLQKIQDLYPQCKTIILTGGEPMLQVTYSFVQLLKEHEYFVAIETNGTKQIHDNIDWITCSPKSIDRLVLKNCSELKVIYPTYDPLLLNQLIESKYQYVQPFYSSIEKDTKDNIIQCVEFVKRNTNWRLSLQAQKLIGID